MVTLSSRLLAGFSSLALLAAVGLFASLPAHTAGGPVPVTVTNAPLAVSVGPVQQPFATRIFITIKDGANQGADNGIGAGTQTIQIPIGKRLVVQTLSTYRNGSSPDAVQVFVNAELNGNYIAYALPFVPATSAGYSGISQALTFQADGGTRLLINAFRTGSTGQENDVVAVSGYLVDAP
jgi:hypothetical protein